MKHSLSALSALALLVFLGSFPGRATPPPAPSFVHFEARQTHPVALTANGTRLVAINSLEGRLSVLDISNPANPAPVLIGEIPVGMEPVSVRARTDDEVWVVNEVSDSVSIVSLRRGAVVATLPCPDEPADVAFARGRAFVSCARNSLVRVFDVETRASVGVIPVQGQAPRALAVSADGGRVFVAFQLSGNGTTVLPAGQAPPQPPPANPDLPLAPATALIVPASDPRIPYVVRDHDVAEISTVTLEVVRYHSNLGTSLFDLAMRPGGSELWVANTDARNLTRFEPALNGRFVDNRITRLTWPAGAAAAFDLNPAIDPSRPPDPATAATALAQPTAIVFAADGASGWLAAFASDRVARFNPDDGTILARVEVRTPLSTRAANSSRRMRGPRGLVLHEGHQRLYVLNKLADTISVVDTVAARVVAEVPVGSHDPMPASVREGRGFLFDARLSGHGTSACGSCHLDADRDGLAWDLGDPNGAMTVVIGADFVVHETDPIPRPMHPMKGPMVTQTLRGLATNQLLHWRGDRPTLRHFNPTFRDLMAGELQADADMDALESYLRSLRHHPNPHRALDNAMPATFNGGNPTRGRTLFVAHINHCGVCHVLPTGSDNNVDDLRNLGGTQSVKTPALQTLYQRALLDTRPGVTNVAGFGLMHDGTGGRQGLPTVHFYELDSLTGTGFADVASFLLCFETGVVPAVGSSGTLTVQNRADAALLSTWATVESQARSNACDLVVRGRLGGRWQQFLYDRAAQAYLADRTGEPARTRSELLALLEDDDALTFLGTLAGDGPRLGRDRNANAVPDGDEAAPALTVERRGPGLRLSWPTARADWRLEQAAGLDGPWSPDLSVRPAGPAEPWLDLPSLHEPSEIFRLRRVW